MPSRIGTAPLRPDHSTNSRSPRLRSDRQQEQPDEHAAGRPGRAARRGRARSASRARRLRSASGTGQAEHGERHDLAQAGQRAVEPLDLALVRRAQVADAGSRRRRPPGSRSRGAAVASAVDRRRRRAASAAGRGRRWAAAPGASAATAAVAAGQHRPRAPSTIWRANSAVPVPDGVPAAGPRRRPAALPSRRCRPGRWRPTRPRAGCRTGRRSRGDPAPRRRRPGRWVPAATPRSSAGASRSRRRGARAAATPPAVTSVPDDADPERPPRPPTGTGASRCACRRRTAAGPASTVTIRWTVDDREVAEPGHQVGGDRGGHAGRWPAPGSGSAR